MESSPPLSTAASPTRTRTIKVLPEEIKSLEDAKEILAAHTSTTQQPLLVKYINPTAELFTTDPVCEEFFYICQGALEFLRDGVEEMSELSIVCGQIMGLYSQHTETLQKTWGPDKVRQLPELEHRPHVRELRHHSAPSSRRGAVGRFFSQAEQKDVRGFERGSFEELERFFDVSFDFPRGGLNGHGGRIMELFDGKGAPVSRSDFGIFECVFTKLQGAPANTIEGQIRLDFVEQWHGLHDQRSIPFSFDEAMKINELLGASKIKDLRETYSMLDIPENFYTEMYPSLLTHQRMIRDLYDRTADRSTIEAQATIAAVSSALSASSKDVHDPSWSIYSVLVGSTSGSQPSGRTPPRRKDTSDTVEGRSLAQNIMMAGAMILTLYLANRFVLQPALQWYRTRNMKV